MARPKPVTQMLFLSSLAAQAASGGDVKAAVQSLVDRMDLEKYDNGDLAGSLTASESLEALQFEPLAVTLTRAGEAAGRLAESLRLAAERMQSRLETIQALKKSIMPAAFNLIAAVAALIVAPMVLGPMMADLSEQGDIDMELNTASAVLLGLQDFYSTAAWGVPLVLAGVYFYRRSIWRMIRGWPVFSTIWEMQKLARAIRFLSTWRPLFETGVANEQSLQLIEAGVPEGEKVIYQAILEHVDRGASLSDAIEREADDWPSIFVTGFSGFEQAEPKSQEQTLDMLEASLEMVFGIQAKALGRNAGIFAMLSILLVIVLMIVGLYVPIWGGMQGANI